MPKQHVLSDDDFNSLSQLVTWWNQYPLTLNLETKFYDQLATTVFDQMCKLANKTLNGQYLIEKFEVEHNQIVVNVLIMDGNRQQHMTVIIERGQKIAPVTVQPSIETKSDMSNVRTLRPRLQVVNTTKTPVLFNVT